MFYIIIIILLSLNNLQSSGSLEHNALITATRAAFNLGNCYVGRGNYVLATPLYQFAADQGHAPAQSNLGFCYHLGRGVDQNYVAAVRLYDLAAKQGHARAQNDLGNCYAFGLGVDQNYDTAVYWYKLAAKQDHEKSQRNLGQCYIKMGEQLLKQRQLPSGDGSSAVVSSKRRAGTADENPKLTKRSKR